MSEADGHSPHGEATKRRRGAALDRTAQALSRLRGDDGGAVAIIFALLCVPLLMFVFAAIDYSRAADVRTFLLRVADGAALTGVTDMSMQLTDTQAQKLAQSYFDSEAARVKFARDIAGSVSVTRNSTQRVVNVAFTASVPTSTAGLFGKTTVSVAGTASAVGVPPVYMDFYMLLDNTPSMGVGATTSDIDTMVGNTSDKCAFACHDISAGSNDYYSLAKKLGVTMRIDVVRQATQQLMDTAAHAASVPGQFRAGVYTFGTSCSNVALTTVAPLSSVLSGVKSSASAVDLMTTPNQNYNNDQCTDYDGVIGGMNGVITTPGDGVTASSPQKILFFVADGVADAYYPSTCSRPTTSGRCQEPLTTATCTAIKNRGIKIAVLYTTYLPLPTNGWYNTWIAPFQSSLNPTMSSCASPGLFFEVSPSQGISEAMTALFQLAVAQGKLTR